MLASGVEALRVSKRALAKVQTTPQAATKKNSKGGRRYLLALLTAHRCAHVVDFFWTLRAKRTNM